MTWCEFLFQTGDHHFQWVGISALLAGIGLIFNAIWNRKSFRADLISKNRIEWMNTARSLISDLGIYAESAISAGIVVVSAKTGFYKNEKLNDLTQKANDELSKYTKTAFNLHLYISTADDNKKLNDAIDGLETVFSDLNEEINGNEIDNQLKNYDDFLNYHKKSSNKIFEARNELMTVARTYFKNEWERAKRGE
ncbi:hypothetical protein H9L19_06375 [Weissella diestrammenae]|uniref:Uncharacterized protein n=1 Tax=Weissella diestrammenae TaxID=1162633 RepID=A0A7G9T4I3_9LACO|nr:hypothetical protein [Weissella diestrammenae]MCM0582142.1 hypothetical protein [Weissella diestrammenae]QNN75008.1 hypothetical protein H9L19_06375 [Weissella diestrammenae]